VKTFATTILFLALAAFGSAHAQGIYPGDAVSINGETISYQRFQGFYIEYRNSKGVAVGARGDQLDLLTRLRREAMNLLIEQALVAQAAEKAGVEADPEAINAAYNELRSVFDSEEAFRMKLEGDGFTPELLRTHLARMLAAQQYLDGIRNEAADVSDTDLERYYEDNQRRLTLPEQVRVRHILITWKPMGKPDDRAFIRESMNPILERARAGEDFAALAREFSDDYATRQSGGDTGFFHRGQMAPAFEEAAFALQPGEISEVVETSFGVHIIKFEERQEEELLALEDVRDQLLDHVRNERAEQAVRAEIDGLADAADIKILIPLGPSDEQNAN
jgi:parvulin-like peptidyl-prolyl isomerase